MSSRFIKCQGVLSRIAKRSYIPEWHRQRDYQIQNTDIIYAESRTWNQLGKWIGEKKVSEKADFDKKLHRKNSTNVIWGDSRHTEWE